MAKRRVNVDRYTWRTPIEGMPGSFDTHVAGRDAIIDVSEAEAKRVPGALVAVDAETTGPTDTPLAAGGTPLAETVGAAVQGDRPATDPAPPARAATTDVDLTQVLTDEQISRLTVPLVQAYVVEHPDELDRVLDLEQNRDGGPRAGVTGLAR